MDEPSNVCTSRESDLDSGSESRRIFELAEMAYWQSGKCMDGEVELSEFFREDKGEKREDLQGGEEPNVKQSLLVDDQVVEESFRYSSRAASRQGSAHTQSRPDSSGSVRSRGRALSASRSRPSSAATSVLTKSRASSSQAQSSCNVPIAPRSPKHTERPLTLSEAIPSIALCHHEGTNVAHSNISVHSSISRAQWRTDQLVVAAPRMNLVPSRVQFTTNFASGDRRMLRGRSLSPSLQAQGAICGFASGNATRSRLTKQQTVADQLIRYAAAARERRLQTGTGRCAARPRGALDGRETLHQGSVCSSMHSGLWTIGSNSRDALSARSSRQQAVASPLETDAGSGYEAREKDFWVKHREGLVSRRLTLTALQKQAGMVGEGLAEDSEQQLRGEWPSKKAENISKWFESSLLGSTWSKDGHGDLDDLEAWRRRTCDGEVSVGVTKATSSTATPGASIVSHMNLSKRPPPPPRSRSALDHRHVVTAPSGWGIQDHSRWLSSPTVMVGSSPPKSGHRRPPSLSHDIIISNKAGGAGSSEGWGFNGGLRGMVLGARRGSFDASPIVGPWTPTA